MADIENNNTCKKLIGEPRLLQNNDLDHINMKDPDEGLCPP